MPAKSHKTAIAISLVTIASVGALTYVGVKHPEYVKRYLPENISSKILPIINPKNEPGIMSINEKVDKINIVEIKEYRGNGNTIVYPGECPNKELHIKVSGNPDNYKKIKFSDHRIADRIVNNNGQYYYSVNSVQYPIHFYPSTPNSPKCATRAPLGNNGRKVVGRETTHVMSKKSPNAAPKAPKRPVSGTIEYSEPCPKSEITLTTNGDIKAYKHIKFANDITLYPIIFNEDDGKYYYEYQDKRYQISWDVRLLRLPGSNGINTIFAKTLTQLKNEGKSAEKTDA